MKLRRKKVANPHTQLLPINPHLFFLSVVPFLVSVTPSLTHRHTHSRRKELLSNDVSTLRGGLDARPNAITKALTSIILC